MSLSYREERLSELILEALKKQAQEAAAGEMLQLNSLDHMVVYLEHELGRKWGPQVRGLSITLLSEHYKLYQSLCPSSRSGAFQSNHTDHYTPVLRYSSQTSGPDALTEDPAVSFLEA